VTVQFRVKASKVGTVSVSVENSARDRSYVTTVSISAANTWETKTVTIPGDTSGTWLTTNGVGLDLKFGIMSNGSWLAGTGGSWLAGRAILSTSQTNFIAVSGDYITITGVQLEAGSVATPFEQIDYGRELMLCQRYAIRYCGETPYSMVGMGWETSASNMAIGVILPVSMRTQPSITTSGNFLSARGSAITSFTLDTNVTNTKSVYFNCGTSAGVAGFGTALLANNSTAVSFLISAEL
jgi:hypothetical protein